jgi:hypothetical protein
MTMVRCTDGVVMGCHCKWGSCAFRAVAPPDQQRWWRFAVLRGEGIPADYDGRWMDLGPVDKPALPVPVRDGGMAFVPTNRWERRGDGEVAVVYEMRR